DDPVMNGVEYAGIEGAHRIALDAATHTGRVDLWHLLQVPVGSVLIVPLRGEAATQNRTPVCYGIAGDWVERCGYISWSFTGRARAKFGLSAAAVTGRAAVLRDLGGDRRALLVREFSVDERAVYADHPHGVPRTDQVLQAWDGFGFGELEYHSPA